MTTLSFERFMRESNAIEGEFYAEASSQYPAIGALHEHDLEVMEYMEKRASAGLPPTEKDLLHIHKLLSEGRDMQYKGKYRKCEVQIGNRMGLSWEEVPTTMKKFFERDWPTFDAWRLHIIYEHCHPFEDLNGRTGRILWAWKMIQEEQDPFRLPFLQRFYYQTLSQ